VIELTQWSRAHAWKGDRQGVIDGYGYGYGSSPNAHPVAQMRGDCQYRTEFTRSLHDFPRGRCRAAQLHDADSEAAVADLWDYPQDAYGRLFTSARRVDWLDFLTQHLARRCLAPLRGPAPELGQRAEQAAVGCHR